MLPPETAAALEDAREYENLRPTSTRAPRMNWKALLNRRTLAQMTLRDLWRKLTGRRAAGEEPDMRPTRDKWTEIPKGSYGLPVKPYSEEKPTHDESPRWR
jgi:hypothetical protein